MKARFPRAHSLRPPAACPPLARPAARRRLKPRLTAPGSRPRLPQPASPSSSSSSSSARAPSSASESATSGPRGDGSGRSVGPGRPVRVVLLLKVAMPRAVDAEPRDRLIVLPLILVGPPPSRAVGGRRAPSGTRSGGRRDGLGKNRDDGSIGSTDGIRAGDGSDAIRSRGAGRAHRCSFRSQPRATTVLDAWARGRTIMESMLTWAGRSSAQVMHSAISCALRGPSTPA